MQLQPVSGNCCDNFVLRCSHSTGTPKPSPPRPHRMATPPAEFVATAVPFGNSNENSASQCGWLRLSIPSLVVVLETNASCDVYQGIVLRLCKEQEPRVNFGTLRRGKASGGIVQVQRQHKSVTVMGTNIRTGRRLSSTLGIAVHRRVGSRAHITAYMY
eukprot:SAG31_NODE_1627_length_7705_cov_5.310939_10_plen_159_part_00